MVLLYLVAHTHKDYDIPIFEPICFFAQEFSHKELTVICVENAITLYGEDNSMRESANPPEIFLKAALTGA